MPSELQGSAYQIRDLRETSLRDYRNRAAFISHLAENSATRRRQTKKR